MRTEKTFPIYHRAGNLFLAALCAMLMLLLGGCGKAAIEPGVSLAEVLVEYGLDAGELYAFSATEDGTVFLLGFLMPEEEASPFPSSGFWIYRYNAQGECTASYPLDDYLPHQAIAASEDGRVVYFTGEEIKKSKSPIALYALDTDTGKVGQLFSFPQFRQVMQLVAVGDRVYVLGLKNSLSRYRDFGDSYDFNAGDTLVYCSLTEGEVYEMALAYPYSFARGEGEELAISAYFPSDGFCLLDYDPKTDTLSFRQKLGSHVFNDFAVCDGGDSLIYDNPQGRTGGLVVAPCDDLETEVQVYENIQTSSKVGFFGGRVYCEDSVSSCLVSFPLEAVRKKNAPLRIMSYKMRFPYACGYAMEHEQEYWDKIVLKVLAQDSDYDLFLADSSDSGVLALKNSTTFYPLDDVPGVQEYFDLCQPYIREAATNEDGAVWMFPFAVMLPSLLVNQEVAGSMGVSPPDGMTILEFSGIIHGLGADGASMVATFPILIAQSYVNQYFQGHIAADSTFFATMQELKCLYDEMPKRGFAKVGSETLFWEKEWGADPLLDRTAVSSAYSIHSSLKGEATDKNAASCLFLIVNPNSPRLKETLSYVSELANYLSSNRNFWYLREPLPDPTPLEESVYRLYEDAEIIFGIDEEVYMVDFEDMMEGKISVEDYAAEASRRLRIYLGE